MRRVLCVSELDHGISWYMKLDNLGGLGVVLDDGIQVEHAGVSSTVSSACNLQCGD